MKCLLLAALSLCLFSPAKADITPLADGENASPSNDSLYYLRNSKLDVRPGNIVPRLDSAYNLGSSGTEWAALYVDTVTATGQITSANHLPKTDSTYNLGASGTEWANLYVDTITATNIISSNLYNSVANNLVVTRPGVTSVTVTCDKLGVENYVVSSVNVTAAITSSGANGLDTGAEAASTWYSIWVIYNPTTSTTAALLSASLTSPTMPSGYTLKRRIGFVFNNAGSDFNNFRITGDTYYHWWDTSSAHSINGAGATGAFTTLTLNAQTSPSLEMIIFLGFRISTNATGGGSGYIRPTGSSWSPNPATSLENIDGASQERGGGLQFIQNSSRQVDYYLSANISVLTLNVLGFKVPPL